MYPEYFGLTEASFSITPDPQYLYLSRRHSEALAHLVYGAGAGGGFVLLTGEVGTGKTTICRTFLEQLPEQVDLALILNPALSVAELLHTVCDEFGVRVPPGESSTKVLVDHLNAYLLTAHAAGRRPVLMIDEAQNLSVDVLEQIRLLTNLETTRHKLLQIFLVGQPELRTLLAQERLRQLAQRITARYHLEPLDAAETTRYVHHRLAVAGARRPLFTAGALRRIHGLTGGIPRLVNILCDRALLGAYATRRERVDVGIVKRAARELRGETEGGPRSPRLQALGWTVLLAAAVVIGWLLWRPLAPPLPASAPAGPGADARAAPVPPIAPSPPPDVPPSAASPPAEAAPPAAQPEDFILGQDMAWEALLARWGLTPGSGSAHTAPCSRAATLGVSCRKGNGTWNNLRRYRRPALIRLHAPGRTGYALVAGLSAERVALAGENGATWLPKAAVEPLWLGEFLLLWRPPLGNAPLIGPGASAESVRWLRTTLARLPGAAPEATPDAPWDPALGERVRAFQRSAALEVDGIAGPETLIQLNSAADLPGIPHLDLGN